MSFNVYNDLLRLFIIIRTIIIINLVTKHNAIVSGNSTTKLHMYLFVQLYLPQR